MAKGRSQAGASLGFRRNILWSWNSSSAPGITLLPELTAAASWKCSRPESPTVSRLSWPTGQDKRGQAQHRPTTTGSSNSTPWSTVLRILPSLESHPCPGQLNGSRRQARPSELFNPTLSCLHYSPWPHLQSRGSVQGPQQQHLPLLFPPPPRLPHRRPPLLLPPYHPDPSP